MPLYEYGCLTCRERFEKLVRLGQTGDIVCPRCNSSSVLKAVSTFASFGGGADGFKMASGGCCGGGGGCACAR